MNRFYLGNTVRGRILLLAIGVEVLMLSILVFNSQRLLHRAMTAQAKMQAEQFYPVLNAALTAPLLQRDYATVQAVIDESRTAGGVDYIVATDLNGKRAGSSGWPADKPLPEPSLGIELLTTTVPRYDISMPIRLLDQKIGQIHFGLNLSQIVAARRLLLTQGISIAVIEIILSSLIMMLIGFWLTRHLDRITYVSRQVAAGNLNPPLLPEGADDVGQMGIAFNTMSRTISERVNDLLAAKSAAEISERTISKSEERLKLALAGANLGLWDWNLASGKVTYSIEWAGMLGYTPDELDSSVNAWEALIHPDDAVMVHETLQSHIAGKLDMYETEHRCRAKNGEWRWILDRGRVVERDNNGTPVRAAGTHLDITDRKLAESRLYELNESLEQRVHEEVQKNRDKDAFMLHQDKMASIGQLAAGVAHEVNNPMAFITNNLRMLKDYEVALSRFFSQVLNSYGDGMDAARRESLDEAAQKLDIPYILHDIGPLIAESIEGAERVNRIVLDLKEFARADDNNFAQVDLNTCVKSTLNIVRNVIKYVAQVKLELADLPPVFCSANQINQVIANLLINAAQAIDRSGTITISTRHDDREVILEVADTGCGMEESVAKRIFEPFFTTKDIGEGTGLGLTISYGIVKEHGGLITVASTPGSGTVFTVRLPLDGPEAAES